MGCERVGGGGGGLSSALSRYSPIYRAPMTRAFINEHAYSGSHCTVQYTGHQPKIMGQALFRSVLQDLNPQQLDIAPAHRKYRFHRHLMKWTACCFWENASFLLCTIGFKSKIHTYFHTKTQPPSLPFTNYFTDTCNAHPSLLSSAQPVLTISSPIIPIRTKWVLYFYNTLYDIITYKLWHCCSLVIHVL